MEKIAKRIFDFLLSLLGLIILSPVFLIIAVLIKLDSRGPVFFRQERVGFQQRRFKILKFRTMINGADSSGVLATNYRAARITRIGKILRKYKLDEIPQFYNILIGEMSIVGPRPEVPKYVKHYEEQQKNIIFSVKPGAMGMGTLNYMDEEKVLDNSSNVEEFYTEKILPKKIMLDVAYVQNRSFIGDLKLFIKNILLIFIR